MLILKELLNHVLKAQIKLLQLILIIVLFSRKTALENYLIKNLIFNLYKIQKIKLSNTKRSFIDLQTTQQLVFVIFN